MPERFKRRRKQIPGGYIARDPLFNREGRFLDLVEGQVPYYIWNDYEEIKKEIIATPRGGYLYGGEEEGTRQGEADIRRMHNISDKPFVLFAPGTHEILERLITRVLPDLGEFNIKAVPPYFPEVYNFANSSVAVKSGITISKTDTYLMPVSKNQSPTADAIHRMIREVNELPTRRDYAVYASGVNSFTGEIVPTDLWHELADATNKKKVLFIADEAVDDARPLEESLIKQTEINDRLIILRSPSKIAGLADERVAYAVGSENFREDYANQQRIFNLNWWQRGVVNRIFDPDVYLPRVEDMLKHTRFINDILKEEFENRNIKYFPFSRNVPFFAIAGDDVGLYNRLITSGVAGLSGAKYNLTHGQLSEKDIRFAHMYGREVQPFIHILSDALKNRPRTYFALDQ